MNGNTSARIRYRIGVGLLGVTVAGTAWLFAPAVPVFRAPRADAKERAVGEQLFEHEWQPHDKLAHGDGLGPVFNDRSCAACHFQGGVGGGGDKAHNVLAFEAHPTLERREVQGGLIHKYAVANLFMEDFDALRQCFPIVPGGVRVTEGCQIRRRDFDPVRTQTVNTTALFGAGWLDRISSKDIVNQSRRTSLSQITRELQSDFGGIGAGRYRVLPDGRIGKFGWKAQFATLEEFVAAACANEIGLGNPKMKQAEPRARWKYRQVDSDLDAAQFRSLVAFVDTLPKPEEILPAEPGARDHAVRGKEVFASVGCAACHTPELNGVAGVYSDFLLHRLDDRSQGKGGYRPEETPDVPIPSDYPLPEEWKTPPLWGVADSAPYFHDGASLTLEDAIKRHHGDAEAVYEGFKALPSTDQSAIIAFLKTLRAPSDAKHVTGRPGGDLALAR